MPPTRRRRTPVPPVEETTEVAPLVEDAPAPAPADVEPTNDETAAAIAAIAAAGLNTEAAAAALKQAGAVLGVEVAPVVEVAPDPATRFVLARNAELGAQAVLSRTALADWPGWEAVEDVPDSEPPTLPAHTED